MHWTVVFLTKPIDHVGLPTYTSLKDFLSGRCAHVVGRFET